ncbi:MAG: GtrA family protein [Eubacteriales bacterium]|nr:GtrA family protein [Eubacteriales bacterium]
MARNEETKKTIWQMVKFAIVGVLNTLVDFAVFQSLNLTLGWVYAAQVLGYSAGVINSYLWNSNWTFREQRTRSFREIALFLVVNFASLGVSLGMIWLCREVFGITNAWVASWMPHALAGFIKGDTVCKLIATAFAIVVNYVGNRVFVFNQKPQESKESTKA